MTTKNESAADADDPIDALLSSARPRQLPPKTMEKAVKASVRNEWQQVVAAGKRRTLYRRLAVAASTVVVLAAAMTALRAPPSERVEVASIEKSLGMVYLLGERAERVELAATASIAAGEVVETRSDSAIGLHWRGGGSLRIGENSRIEFIDNQTVYLHRGRVYFDAEDDAPPRQFVIDSRLGSMTHLGTQYMVAVDDDSLTVAVREGRVTIDGRYHDQTAAAGKQVVLRGSGRPSQLDISAHSIAWSWIEAVAPGIDLDDRTVDDLLRWVARETGHRVAYADAETEDLALSTELIGTVESDPRTALRLYMLTTVLVYEFDASAGVIRVGRSTTREP